MECEGGWNGWDVDVDLVGGRVGCVVVGWCALVYWPGPWKGRRRQSCVTLRSKIVFTCTNEANRHVNEAYRERS